MGNLGVDQMYFRGVGWVEPAQQRVQGRDSVNTVGNEPSDSLRAGNTLTR
jgi:hypothetical protein